MNYRTANGEEKFIGDFGRSTRSEFDEAIANLPDLIKKARSGDSNAGMDANALLWKLANESVGTINIADSFKAVYTFGN